MTAPDDVRRLETPQGPARLHLHRGEDTTGAAPDLVLLLSHGAGAGVDTRDLAALADALPDQGLPVVLLEQPWRVAGRRIAGRPATLDQALTAAVEAVSEEWPGVPLVLGGRSAGARSAARCAAGAGASGVVALSFPLHPPGRPEASRLAELEGAGVPVLVVQGERDTMGRPDEFPDLPGLDIAVVPGGDHGLVVRRSDVLTQEEAMDVVVETVLEWLDREPATDPVGNRPGNHHGA